jgi:hypothetical protein
MSILVFGIFVKLSNFSKTSLMELVTQIDALLPCNPAAPPIWIAFLQSDFRVSSRALWSPQLPNAGIQDGRTDGRRDLRAHWHIFKPTSLRAKFYKKRHSSPKKMAMQPFVQDECGSVVCPGFGCEEAANSKTAFNRFPPPLRSL